MASVEQASYEERELTVDEVEHILREGGINTANWGTGTAKTTAHLHKEIQEGETILSLTPDGKITRSVRVAWVDVLYFDEQGSIYHLVEDRQEYRDGRMRKRQLDSSLGEKLKRDEDPGTGALRALDEELGIQSFKALHAISCDKTTHIPDSYPGLLTDYDTYTYVAILDESSFKPEGYVEVQADKTNYYTWELIRPDGS